MSDLPEIQTGAMDIAILVVSCDAYRDLWPPFFQCFFKYWPDCPYPVFLGANNAGFPDARVSPILVGPDVDYSSNLIKMLNHIPQKWVILWIEDRFLSAPVDSSRLLGLIQLARSRGGVYLKPIANDPLARVKERGDPIGEIPPGEPYRISITVALWQKSTLLKLLRAGESAWDLERVGSGRSSGAEGKFFCLASELRNNPPISNEHIVVKGRLVRGARPFLEKEGLLGYVAQRRLESLRSVCYGRLYLLAARMPGPFNWLRSLKHGKPTGLSRL